MGLRVQTFSCGWLTLPAALFLEGDNGHIA